MSAIGAPLTAPSTPGDAEGDSPRQILALAIRQGLVRFDGAGQVAPGLAARWTIADGGRDLLFRLGDAPHGVAAGAIARRLRLAVAAPEGSALRPLLGAVDSIEGVTPEVVDVALAAPRPDLLPLFAQPALAVSRAGEPAAGPFRLAAPVRGVARLLPIARPDHATPPPVLLRGEPAARAVARFARGGAGLVLGGRFQDLPIARAAALPADRLRFDPAPGLFGFGIRARTSGFLAAASNRAALAMAIDRDRIARVLDWPGWTPREAILPPGLTDGVAPAAPTWSAADAGSRRHIAARTVAAWVAANGALPPLRVAMPDGPGGRLLFALVAADWRGIGISAIAVGTDVPADLVLIDEVAPADTAAFYLRRFACERGLACTEATDAVLIAARRAPSLSARSALFARVDAALAATTPFVPLGQPIRWSLVAPDLDRFRASPRAIHPLDDLRTALDR